MKLLFTLTFTVISLFTKAQIPAGSLIWLKADAGVYTDAGITPATNGQAVQQWNDQTVNGYNVSQTTAARKPTFVAVASDGKPALQFSGAQLMNSLSIVDWSATNVANFFIVCKTTSPNSMLFESCPDLSSYNGGVYMIDNYTYQSQGIAAALRGTNAYRAFKNLAGFIPCTKIYQITFDMTQTPSAMINVKLNNVSLADDAGYGTTSATGLINYLIHIGARSDLTYPLNGNISEIIAYKNALTPAEVTTVYNYLNNKYFSGTGTAQFTSLPTTNVSGNTILDDATYKHGYNSANTNQVIASVKDNCLNLGTITPTVYVDANAALNGGKYTMRRHNVIKVASNPAGTKRARIYYTNADFTDLQAVVPTLTSASQLAVEKFSGLNEGGVYDPTGKTLTVIPAAQIKTGTAFGQNYLEFDIASFSEFWIYTQNAVLPLKFLSFNAQECNKNSVCLNWKTANEQNVSHFEIERSEDGMVFKSIDTKAAMNQSLNTYNTTDEVASLAKSTKIFYRIKQIDTDGKFTYSNVRTVLHTDKISLGIYPNPTSNVLNIAGWMNIKQMQLFDVSGRILLEIKPQAILNISTLLKGNYILKVQMKSGEVLMEKIMKQ